MSRKNNNKQNTIKFSIWETKTDKSHSAAIENSPELINTHNFKRNRRDS